MVGVRFAIRDDDVNYFTDPGEIESAYGTIWDFCPPTISVVTHVKGNWRYWINEIYNRGLPIDWPAWQTDTKIYPIHENKALVKFIKEQYGSGKLDLSLHAIHHRNGDRELPSIRANNYVQGAEFYTSLDLTEKVKDSINYIKTEFEIDLTVFTPPQNLMSLKGYRSVIDNGLSVVGAGIPFWQKEKSIKGLQSMSTLLSFKMRHYGIDYPFVLRFARHSELIHHYPLHPSTKVEVLIEKFEEVYRFSGVFVLSTHYHEFGARLTYDNSRMMKDVFHEFVDYVRNKKNVTYCTLSNLLKT